jgi:hypothetical protein
MTSIAGGVALFASLAAFQQSAPLVDHVFIRVDEVSSAAAALEEIGFTVLPDTSVHVGQGTASRALLFDNGYLELLWVTDPQELRSADPIMADRMLTNEGHSRFGLGLYLPDPDELPFPTRAYHADWMEPGSEILFATTTRDEPTVFVVPGYNGVHRAG